MSAFAAAFTLVFAFIALWVVYNAGTAALKRVEEQLVDATQGTARDVPQPALERLLKLPAGTDVSGLPAYRKIRRDLDSVQATLPEARPYIVAKGPSGSLDYLVVPGEPFRDAVSAKSPSETIEYMLRAFDATVYQGRNDDQFGQWVSAYSPILNAQGEALAVVGMDFPLQYVRNVRTEARQRVLPVLIASYAALLALVWLVSTLLVRPVQRITAASQRIADGDYSQDLSRLTRGRYPDEMSDLADSFGVMVSKPPASRSWPAK